METTELLTKNVPYILGVVGLLLLLLILFSMRRRREEAETKECPHCLGIVDIDDAVCRHCNRNVSNRKI